MDSRDPVLDARRHWAELALDAGWDVGRLCHCHDPEPLALVGSDGWYAANMCGRCRRKLFLALRPDALRASA